MIVYAAVAITSVIVAGLTFFSGFGLGTLLMPLFAVFFPVQVAVAATAVVHLANNIFKAAIVGRHADRGIVLLFGIPAAVAAFGGAWLLGRLSIMPPLATYALAGNVYAVSPVKLAIGVLMIVFALFELFPVLDRFSLSRTWVPVGGVLSGFFGGLSGHQGALRTIFLARVGLTKESFVGTIAVVATLVDIVRIFVYGIAFFSRHFMVVDSTGWTLVGIACVAAWVGSFMGSRFLGKITMRGVRIIVGTLLLILGAGLGSGLV